MNKRLKKIVFYVYFSPSACFLAIAKIRMLPAALPKSTTLP